MCKKRGQTCSKNNNIITTNPIIFITDTILETDFSSSLTGLCNRILTEPEYFELISNLTTIPTINLDLINGTIFDSNTFDITFTIFDANCPDAYVAYLGGKIFTKGNVTGDTPITLRFENLHIEDSGILIKVQNTKGLFSYTGITSVTIHNSTGNG